ncbi:MAG: hypothetical protein C6I01_05575 [Epsilonproteobacteria bacterium]|nr:hypothetical protein [Campylobacterota bacterium]NPA89231.1 hypothetical protein [Campylobacterota bacterium]
MKFPQFFSSVWGGVVGGVLVILFFFFAIPPWRLTSEDWEIIKSVLSLHEIQIFFGLGVFALLFDWFQIRYESLRHWRPPVFGAIIGIVVYYTAILIINVEGTLQDAIKHILIVLEQNPQEVDRVKGIVGNKYDFFIGAIVILALNIRALFRYGLDLIHGVEPIEVGGRDDMIYITPFAVIGIYIFILLNLLLFSFFNKTFTIYSLLLKEEGITGNLPVALTAQWNILVYPLKVLIPLYLMGIVFMVAFVKMTRSFDQVIKALKIG